MVRQHGTSGAFRAYLSALRSIDSSLAVEHPAALLPILEQRQSALEARRDDLAKDVSRRARSAIEGIDKDCDRARLVHEGENRRARSTADALLADVAAIEALPVVGLFKGLVRKYRLWRLRARHRATLAAPEARLRSELEELARRRSAELAILNDPSAEASRLLASEFNQMESLHEVAKSCEARGAQGELEVIRELCKLPDNFVLLNDVELEAKSFLTHNQKPVQSAQVDHLVVGPTGIFLLETKAWSRSFARSGEAFDPFEQVSRAGLLCHCLLNDAGLPAKVRNVVVIRSQLPSSEHRDWVRVVSPERVRSLVTSGRAQLESHDVEEIVGYLRKHFMSASAGWFPHATVRAARWRSLVSPSPSRASRSRSRR